jgi:hypothetical protein
LHHRDRYDPVHRRHGVCLVTCHRGQRTEAGR